VNKEGADVYIARPSIWGNPYSHKPDTLAEFRVASRSEAIQKYREWIVTQPELMAKLPELRGKTLGCFCKPKRCHGDVLVELVNALPEVNDGEAAPAGDHHPDNRGAELDNSLPRLLG
jgi:hypothetical protein